MKKSTTIGIVIIIFVIGLVTFGILKFSGFTSNQKTIDVTETAEIKKDADRLVINVGVETQGNSASEAEDKNKEITNKIYESLKSLGLNEDEYSTESYNVYTDRNWENNQIKGYIVSHNIKIDTEKIDMAGKILDVSIDSGANQIYGLQFTLKEETEKAAREEAYTKASEGARIKAESIAKGLGVKITKIVKITDSTFNYIPYMTDVAYSEVEAKGADMNIQPGDVTVSASISVSYGFR